MLLYYTHWLYFVVCRWTGLHVAVYYEHPYPILMMMLEKCSANEGLIDCRTRDQETALHLAAIKGNCDAAFALIQAGAELNPVDKEFRTPLLAALHYRQDHLTGLLVCSGASVNRVTGSILVPLQEAVSRENLAVARLMLERGAVVVDPCFDDLNWTVIHTVCETGKRKTFPV